MGWPKPLTEKECFIREMVLSNTMSAAFAHVKGGVYAEKPSKKSQSEWEKLKKEFRGKVVKCLDEVVERFEPKDNDYGRIKEFIKNTSDPILLKNGEFSFGVAQKLINLYLKYLWCLGKFDTPPHCPIDAKILKRGNAEKFGPWTEMDGTKYREAIKQIIKTAGSDLATWELKTYNEK